MNVDLTDDLSPLDPFGADEGDLAADGRRARRDRNQASVVEALLELFEEGQLHPTAQQLAQRSGVSLRSVFRYFDDMQELTLRAVEVHLARVAPLFELAPRPEGAPLHERIRTIAEHRAAIHLASGAVVRGAALRFHRSPELVELVESRRRLVRDQVEDYFTPELDRLGGDERQLLLACLDAGCQLESADAMRTRGGLRPDQLADAYVLILGGLLAPFA